MTDIIAQAIAFANRPEHEGSGYTLSILLADGTEMLEVGVTAIPGENGYRLIGDGDGADLFLNPALVSRVVVRW